MVCSTLRTISQSGALSQIARIDRNNSDKQLEVENESHFSSESDIDDASDSDSGSDSCTSDHKTNHIGSPVIESELIPDDGGLAVWLASHPAVLAYDALRANVRAVEIVLFVQCVIVSKIFLPSNRAL